MRRLLAVAGAVPAALALVAPSPAQPAGVEPVPWPPGAGTVALKPSAEHVAFATPVTLSGTVRDARPGVVVSLERRAADANAFVPAGVAVTDGNGGYAFTQRPGESTVYRAAAATVPPSTSPAVEVAVAPLVGLRVTARTRREARFAGTVRPRHDGMRVAIQRRRAGGGWATVAAPRLHDAGGVASRYSVRLRVRRPGTYRAVLAAHADHAQGASRERSVTAG